MILYIYIYTYLATHPPKTYHFNMVDMPLVSFSSLCSFCLFLYYCSEVAQYFGCVGGGPRTSWFLPLPTYVLSIIIVYMPPRTSTSRQSFP